MHVKMPAEDFPNFLRDLLLEPAQALRRELGVSYDLVCVPEAEAAAEVLTDLAARRNYNISINRSKVAINTREPPRAPTAPFQPVSDQNSPVYAPFPVRANLRWYDPRVCCWVCSLHDRPNCGFCGISR